MCMVSRSILRFKNFGIFDTCSLNCVKDLISNGIFMLKNKQTNYHVVGNANIFPNLRSIFSKSTFHITNEITTYDGEYNVRFKIFFAPNLSSWAEKTWRNNKSQWWSSDLTGPSFVESQLSIMSIGILNHINHICPLYVKIQPTA